MAEREEEEEYDISEKRLKGFTPSVLLTVRTVGGKMDRIARLDLSSLSAHDAGVGGDPGVAPGDNEMKVGVWTSAEPAARDDDMLQLGFVRARVDATDLHFQGPGGVASTLPELPPAVAQLHGSLEHLRIDACNLQELPAFVGELTRLKTLGITESQGVEERVHRPAGIQILPAQIGELRGLVQLSLCGTRLEWLPEEVGLLVGLKTLAISSNRLECRK